MLAGAASVGAWAPIASVTLGAGSVEVITGSVGTELLVFEASAAEIIVVELIVDIAIVGLGVAVRESDELALSCSGLTSPSLKL